MYQYTANRNVLVFAVSATQCDRPTNKAVTKGCFGCLNTPEISGKNLTHKNVGLNTHQNYTWHRK